jgi:glycosyltransferase involved in cell wall biosynthesis
MPGLVGDAAVLVPPGDVNAIDAAVRDLLDNPDIRAEYAARGPRRAATWPSQQDTVADVLAAYASVVNSVPADPG